MNEALSVNSRVVASPSKSTSAKSSRWAGLAAMAVAGVSDGMEGGLINTLFPVIMKALGLELSALGLMSSISKYARMLFGTLWSMAADRYGRKRILVFVTGIWGLWTAAAGLAQDFTQLLILYSIGVIGTVASEPIANGLLADMFEKNERGKAYGALRSIGSFGSIVLTPFIGMLANVDEGWRIGMFIMGGVSLLSGILIALFVKEPPRRVYTDDPELGKFNLKDVGVIIRTPTILLLAVQLLFITSLVLFAFFNTYFVTVRGWTTAEAAILNSVFFAGFMVSSFLGGFLGDQFDKKFGPKGRVILMQLYLLAFAGMTFLMMQVDWGRGPLLYAVLFLTGLIGSIGFSGCVLPMVASVVEARYAATSFALLFSFIQGAISATMMLFVGPLAKSVGLTQVMLLLVSLPYLLNALLWFGFYRIYPRDVTSLQAKMAVSQAD
jgi:MFS family permease